MWKVPLFDCSLGAEEKQAVLEVLDSGWLTMGANTRALEEEFARLCGARQAIAVASGTAALHLALLAIGIEPGDEVIVPSLTFSATANAVIHAGGRPVFADIGGDHDLNIDPEAVEAAITTRTRAILVVHYGGYPCDMPVLRRIADRHGLRLIEDAAHAPGARLPEGACGALGDVGCFSFYSNKNMTCGEGGMVTTDDEALAATVRLLRSHGMTTSALDRHQGRSSSYEIVAAGLNYRIDEMRAALARVQLGRLVERNAERKRLDALYREGVAGIDGLGMPFASGPAHDGSCCHVSGVLLDPGLDVEAFRTSLREDGIQTSHHYPAVHLLHWYREHMDGREGTLPRTESASLRQVTLPLYPGMGADRVALVIDGMKRAIARQTVAERA